MAVYVDDLHNYGVKGNSCWCYMWADSIPELVAMTKAIGLTNRDIQTTYPRFIHVFVSESKREDAIARGAKFEPMGRHHRATYPMVKMP